MRKCEAKINEDVLSEEAKLDGCYVIKTNIFDKTASTKIVHDRYKSLSEVEWAFRTMKTTLLHMRGIYVRKDNRTRAHVFVIMLAYLVAYELRRLWCDMELTIEEGIDELSTLCATEIIIGSFSIHTIPKPRPIGEMLLNKAKIDLPDAIPCRNIDVYTRKKLVDQRKDSINQ